MNDIAQLDDMLKLTQATLLAAQTRLAATQGRERALQDQVDALRRKRLEFRVADDPATRGGADLRWQAWVGARLATMNAELAQLRVLKDRQLKDLRKAFGRDRALRALRDRLLVAERQKAIRAGAYVS